MQSIHTVTETYKGATITVSWYPDQDMGSPWKEHDGHGPVSEWTTREKRPGERVLASDGRRKLYYDFEEAIKIAKRDKWDAPPYKAGTLGERAQRAVEADFEYLNRWCRDDWQWVGRIVKIEEYPNYKDSCWGFESDCMEEETASCIESAKEWIDKEQSEQDWAASHEIETN